MPRRATGIVVKGGSLWLGSAAHLCDPRGRSPSLHHRDRDHTISCWLALLGGTAVKRPPTPHRQENIGGTGWEPCGDHPADDRVAQAEETPCRTAAGDRAGRL